MKLNSHSAHSFLSTRMSGNDDRVSIVYGDGIKNLSQFEKIFVRINIFFAMGADHKKLGSH